MIALLTMLLDQCERTESAEDSVAQNCQASAAGHCRATRDAITEAEIILCLKPVNTHSSARTAYQHVEMCFVPCSLIVILRKDSKSLWITLDTWLLLDLENIKVRKPLKLFAQLIRIRRQHLIAYQIAFSAYLLFSIEQLSPMVHCRSLKWSIMRNNQ